MGLSRVRAQELLARLENCPVNFDPLAEHDRATILRRVAFVPVDLYEDVLKALHASLADTVADKLRDI